MRICRRFSSTARRRSRRQSLWPRSNARPRRRRSTQRPPRRPRSMPRPRSSTTRATITFSPSSAPRPTSISRAAIERHAASRQHSRSTSSSCNSRAYPTIPAISNPSFHVRGDYANVQDQDQRRRRAGGRVRTRPVPRHQFHRQYLTPHRRAAGANTAFAPPACSISQAAASPLQAAKSALYGGSQADVHAEHRLRRQLRKLRVFRLGARQLERTGTL